VAARWQSGHKDGVTLMLLLSLMIAATFAASRPCIPGWLLQRESRDVQLKDF